MKNEAAELSAAQQYLLCALKENGTLPVIGQERLLCLVAGEVLELLLEGAVVLEDKKLRVVLPLPAEQRHLYPVWAFIRKRQPVRFEKVVGFFSMDLIGRNTRALIDAVGELLAEKGCVQARTRRGLFGEKTVYLPNAVQRDRVVQQIRAELLEEGNISQETVILTVLLNRSGLLKNYFSRYEKKALTCRLKELRRNPADEMIRQAAAYLDSLLVVMIAATY